MAEEKHNFIAIRRGTEVPTSQNLGAYELGYAINENGLYIGQPKKFSPKKINISNLKDVEPTEDNGYTKIEGIDGKFKISQNGQLSCDSFILVKGQGYGTSDDREKLTSPKEGQIFFQEIVEK